MGHLEVVSLEADLDREAVVEVDLEVDQDTEAEAEADREVDQGMEAERPVLEEVVGSSVQKLRLCHLPVDRKARYIAVQLNQIPTVLALSTVFPQVRQ